MDTATWLTGSQPSLLVLMFHGLYRNKAEALADEVDPYQPFTDSDLRKVIEHFQGSGYHFVSPDKLSLGMRNAPKRVMLTFDDGYANNLRALPIMRQYNVPATFFITGGNVMSGEAFWWDVLHREMTRRGVGRECCKQRTAPSDTRQREPGPGKDAHSPSPHPICKSSRHFARTTNARHRLPNESAAITQNASPPSASYSQPDRAIVSPIAAPIPSEE